MARGSSGSVLRTTVKVALGLLALMVLALLLRPVERDGGRTSSAGRPAARKADALTRLVEECRRPGGPGV
jgi:hypothetical protein